MPCAKIRARAGLGQGTSDGSAGCVSSHCIKEVNLTHAHCVIIFSGDLVLSLSIHLLQGLT